MSASEIRALSVRVYLRRVMRRTAAVRGTGRYWSALDHAFDRAMGCRIILAPTVLAALLMFGPIAAIASARWPATHAGALADAASDQIAVVFTGS